MSNIIIIVADSLRRDALSVYGSANKTRKIEALAKEGTVYERAISNSGWTLPSYISMLTGLYPSEHRIGTNSRNCSIAALHANQGLTRGRMKRLHVLLKRMKFETSLFTTNAWTSFYTGFAQDFDHTTEVWEDASSSNSFRRYNRLLLLKEGAKKLLEPGLLRLAPPKSLDSLNLRLRRAMGNHIFGDGSNGGLDFGAEAINRAIERYLRLDYEGNKSLFMLASYMEPHEYYPLRDMIQNKWFYMSGAIGFDHDVRSRLIGIYNKRIVYLDAKIGELIDLLKKKGLYEDSLIVLLSDHGQHFGEHGLLFHGRLLYEELIHVPLIIKHPAGYNLKKKRDGALFELRHVYDLIRASGSEKKIEGEMLRVEKQNYAISEYFGGAVQDFGDTFLLRSEKSGLAKSIFDKKASLEFNAVAFYKKRFKLIASNSKRNAVELFDLSKDPMEKRNLADKKEFLGVKNQMLRELKSRKGRTDVIDRRAS